MRNTDSQFLIDLGRRIARCRKMQNISQEKLAEMADISGVYLSYIEHGRKNPGAEILCKIAEALQVSLDTLLLPNIPVTPSCMDTALCHATSQYDLKQKESLITVIHSINALIDTFNRHN